MNEVFTFVDASHLIAKASLWEEWDEALKQKFEKLNNEVLFFPLEPVDDGALFFHKFFQNHQQNKIIL